MNITDLQNELESRRADSAQLERMVTRINAALPDFKSMMGSEADHAELALQAMITERAALVAVAEAAKQQVGYGQAMAFGNELKSALANLAAVRGGKAGQS